MYLFDFNIYLRFTLHKESMKEMGLLPNERSYEIVALGSERFRLKNAPSLGTFLSVNLSEPLGIF